MTKRLLLSIVLGCGALPAFADSCTIGSVAPVVFGGYTGSAIRITGTVYFQCAAGSTYSIALSGGTGSGAATTDRRMSGAGGALRYNLFSDAGYAIDWGNTTATGMVTGRATGAQQFLTVYAQLAGQQYAPAGSYTDTITATISGSFAASSMQLSVGANVVKACTVTASSLAFGSYTGSQLDSTATISAQCTSGATYQIGLDPGTAPGATVTHRKMLGPGAAVLSYNLYSNSGRSVNWGNTPGADTVAGSGSGGVQALTVYGQIPAGQSSLTPGNYTDTVTVTLTY